MTLPVPDRADALREMRDSATRFTDLLRGVRHPQQKAIGYWSTTDVATHTSHICRILDDMLDGKPSPLPDHRSMPEYWDSALEEDSERDLGVLASRIDESVASIEKRAEANRWEERVTWHGGIPMPVYSLPAIVVSESELHGLDVANSEGRGWSISCDKARLAIYGLLPSLPHFVREETARGLAANWRLKLRGGATVYLYVRDGELEITQTKPSVVDCTVSADPVEYLLVGYGRKKQWGPVLTGKIAAYGRKPWLSLKLAKLFITP
jgi:hypothetical protein